MLKFKTNFISYVYTWSQKFTLDNVIIKTTFTEKKVSKKFI